MTKMCAAACVVALCGGAAGAFGQQLTTVRIASGLARPVMVTAPPGDTARLFFVEQRGSAGVANRGDIRILNLADNSINTTPFLSVTGLATGSEQGLLGLAFDPNYASNGFFYTYHTASTFVLTVTRWQVSGDPNVANAASATPVLSQSHSNFNNHNGGWIAFGPDGYLYIAMGDGGNFCDTLQNAQNLNALLGKMLRIDVSSLPYAIPPTNPFFNQAGRRGEIWAYGLRNPWRNCFDRATGELYIADVGQDVQEEVNVQPPGVGGRNYGWNCREGFVCSTTAPSSCTINQTICPSCVLASATNPVWTHNHAGTSNCSITGGCVYRGCAMPWLRGNYFFSDYCANQIWTFVYTGVQVPGVVNRTAELAIAGFTINGIVAFGEDALGELYICDTGTIPSTATSGEIYKIIPRCPANCDGSTASPTLNVADFSCFLNSFASGDCFANCDGSTAAPILNVADFSCYLNQFAAGTGSAGCP